MKKPTYYEVLGVPRDATPEQIKAAYREKRGALHPDREGGDAQGMSDLNAAHTTLSDPLARAKYDATLPDIERDAQMILGKFIAESSNTDGDLMAAINQKIDAARFAALSGRQQAEDHLTALTRHRKRLKFSGKGTSFVLKTMDLQQKNAEDHIEAMNQLDATLDRAAALLADHEYEMPDEVQFDQTAFAMRFLGAMGQGGTGGGYRAWGA